MLLQPNQDQRREVITNTATKLYRFDQVLLARLRKEHLSQEPMDTVAIAVLSESHDYLKGAMGAIKGNNIRSAGSLLRSQLESAANIYWIGEDKSEKRAKKYLKTIDSLTEYMDNMSEYMKGPDTRIPLDVSRWTSSSAEDRLKFFSPQALLIWDYCSLFTHAQPSLIQYVLRSPSDKVPLFISGQVVVYALTVRHIIGEYTQLLNKKEEAQLMALTTRLMPMLL